MRSLRSWAAAAAKYTSVNATGSISPAPMPRPKSLAVIFNHVSDMSAPLQRFVATVATPPPMDNPSAANILRDMDYTSDIAIVGGGLNGCALAIALASGGHSVTLIDRLPLEALQSDTFDGRSYALALASKRLLTALGLWGDLQEHAQPMLEIKVTDGRAGEGPAPFWMHFDHAEIEEGPMGFMVQDRHLRRAFLNAIAANAKITHLTGQTVIAQSTDHTGASVTLDSGED